MALPATNATHLVSSKGIAEMLEELNTLLSGPVDAASFEAVRSQLVEQVSNLRSQLKIPSQAEPAVHKQANFDPGLPGRRDANPILEMALQSGARMYVATVWVERVPLILGRYGQGVAEQVMQVCSQQVIGRILRASDQLFYWGGAGLLAVLQRDDNLSAVRSELMRVLATPVNQYFETEHRTIYLPIRMSGEMFPVTGTLDGLQEQFHKYFAGRS